MQSQFYDNPLFERYALLGAAFGGGTLSRTLIGPPQKKGLVRDMVVTVTTAMVGTTSVPELRVGTAASDNSFARWLMGTTATAGYGTGAFRARSLCFAAQGRTGNKAQQLNDFANHIALEGNNGSGTVSTASDANGFCYMPADTAFFITGVAGVGGTPAGTADVYVDVDWS
jgi:hypothetical protein